MYTASRAGNRTNWSGTNHLKSKYWTKEETKPNDYPIKEKILDVLKLSPGHQGKSPPMTERRIAEISLRENLPDKR